MDLDAREIRLLITHPSFNEAISNAEISLQTMIHEVMKPQTCTKNASLITRGLN
jgi:hypothetical protein